MTEDHKIWVDLPRYSERWEFIEKFLGGGQGRVGRARRKCDGREAFLKVIKSKGNQERRARFFKEATAYDTIRVPGIPQLIESNAHQWKNAEVVPYIVTEFVEGPTLRQWREAQISVELDTAIETTRQLLAILNACHADGLVHRDVKPDNIILADGDASHPVLLDFGLNYHKIEGVEFATEHEQEVGNRFLRLPELSAGSPSKQDPRTDLSFVGGILFYMLTSHNPNVLQDAEGRLPHQRPEERERLRSVAGSRLSTLLSLFDSAFSPLIAERVPHAGLMLEKLDDVMKPRVIDRSAEDLLQSIRQMKDTRLAWRLAQTHKRLDEALRQLQRVHEEVRKSLELPVHTQQSGWNVSGALARNTLKLLETGSGDVMLSLDCEAREAGDEIVISLSGEPIFRTSIANPSYGDRFDAVVEHWLLARLHDAVTNPDRLPPEAGIFREQRPHAVLEEAQAEALRSKRNILAFVYDPTQEQDGQLQYQLRHFLQNRKTRDTINAAFIVALVPLPQVAAVTTILKEESMESSRWIVLDPNLNPLKQAVIYANPQEGERIALDLADRYGS